MVDVVAGGDRRTRHFELVGEFEVLLFSLSLPWRVGVSAVVVLLFLFLLADLTPLLVGPLSSGACKSPPVTR